jgi:hypothetical protein
MSGIPDLFKEETGEPIQVGDQQVIPVARSLCLIFPGKTGGLIWNRPSAVKVRQATGAETVLPVVDVTRQAVITILAGGFLASLLIWLLFRNHR